MGIATRLSFLVMIPLFIVADRAATRFQHREWASAAMAATAHAPFTAPMPPITTQQDDANDQGAVDLYGNQITDAVARYKLDAEGSLYELHSPRTELPRLRPPKS
ncbi:MAG TPA: hypothetical protein VHU82_06315 [Vicinamibacterales bacterium]|jgi:hypothetical protein|nr:hypothetical protein [Vicinamibacterales bacterium]